MTAGPCSDIPSGYPEPLAVMEITTQSARQTYDLGQQLGRCLQAPFMIGLSGDLGAGKTLLVQGLAGGLEVAESIAVTSPTYTLINEYPGKVPLFHLDLYRIDEPEQLEDIGFDDIAGADNIVAVEWAERLAFEDLQPDLFILIRTSGDTTRRFCLIFYGPDAANLIGALQKTLRHSIF